ncbi:MAG: YigZ family protein [Firmicutes bacterium]|nr:YigZ family protein [Bacillota bacterium]MBQ9973161.1 YigZ family protein [Bacillota bacterium]
MILYRTIQGRAEAEQIIEKSRFISYIKPVESKEEADEFVAEIRAMHRQATHNVPAYVIGDKMQIQWASDDGEPQGTSGAPIVQMLVKEGVTNVAVVVTRYFGGIKLGTGGLVRAYTSSAKLALNEAGICDVCDMTILDIKVDYSYLAKIQNTAMQNQASGDGVQFVITDTKYEDAVTLTVSVDPDDAEALKAMFSNYTSGTAVIVSEKTELAQKPVV